MESLTLTTPIAISTVTISRLLLDWTGASIWIVLITSDGKRLEYNYSGATATTLMTALNTGNFSVTSLHHAIINRLITDHPELAGIISGTPE